MLQWPEVLTAIQASGSTEHQKLNDIRDQMLGLVAWFQSQDISAPEAGTLLPFLLGLMVGAKASSVEDTLAPVTMIGEGVMLNALHELERKSHVRT